MNVAAKCGSLLIAGACVAFGSPAGAYFLSYSVDQTDSAASDFVFSFSTPVPVGALVGPVTYSISITGNLTDSHGGPGIAALAISPDTSIFSFFVDGIELFSPPSASFTTTSSFSNSYSGTYNCPAVVCSSLGADLRFLGTGDGDRYAFTAKFEVLEDPAARVPEPASMALVGLGLAGLSFSRRKQ